MYDTLMRLPFLTWVLLGALAQLPGLSHADIPMDSVSVIHMAMRLSTIAFLLLLAATVLLRTRPSAKAAGLEPRISALAGTFLMYGVVFFPRRDLSPVAEVVATLLTLIGSAGAVVALLQLGRSFSIMAEARRLVISGLYGFIRHPLYLAEELAIIGILMQFLSVWTVLLCIAHLAFQLRRIHNEEKVLASSFPEYAAYQARTARLLPGIY